MSTLGRTDEDCIDAIRYIDDYGDVAAAARATGIPRTTLRDRRTAAIERGLISPSTPYAHVPPFTAQSIPDELPPIEELIENRRKNWERKDSAKTAKKLIGVNINVDGPIGIMLFGDVHIDDQGMNFPLLEKHLGILQNTPGMMAICVGDLQNSWVGRLGHLYAEQSTTAREALALMEWMIESMGDKLIAIVEGNHDLWAVGVNGKSPIEWIRDKGRFVSDAHGVRLGLKTPTDEEYIINCRHDFTGRSQWNTAHGVAKAAHMGFKDDVLIAGHTHVSGYQVLKDAASGRVSHALRIASYKHWDDFADSKGFPDQNIFECPVLIMEPNKEDQRHRVQVIFDPQEASEYLQFKRSKWKRENPK